MNLCVTTFRGNSSRQHNITFTRSLASPETPEQSIPFNMKGPIHPSSHQTPKTPASPPSLLRSRSIPIQKNRLKPTPSELRLREDETLADLRDYVMFRRIYDRLSRSNDDSRFGRENAQCMAHIVQVRNGQDDSRFMISDFARTLQDSVPSTRATSADEDEEEDIFVLEM